MTKEQVEQVRRFSRTTAERIGVLHEHHLGGTRPYGQARLLWQLGDDGGPHDVRTVRDRLGLDSGYLVSSCRRWRATAWSPSGPTRTTGGCAPYG